MHIFHGENLTIVKIESIMYENRQGGWEDEENIVYFGVRYVVRSERL